MHLREYDVTFNYCISGHFKIKKNLTVMEKKNIQITDES